MCVPVSSNGSHCVRPHRGIADHTEWRRRIAKLHSVLFLEKEIEGGDRLIAPSGQRFVAVEEATWELIVNTIADLKAEMAEAHEMLDVDGG